jgi:SAM-dependent methyltransferase
MRDRTGVVQLREPWERAARLVAEHRDVIDGRPAAAETPGALVARDWAPYLLDLGGNALAELERRGHEATWPDGAPPSLLAMVEQARAVNAVEALSSAPLPLEATAHRRETPRKRAQVDAFVGLLAPLAEAAERVVDVGSGHGHLTRAIAERLARPGLVVGLERDDALTARARALSPPNARAGTSASAPAFAQTDVLRDGLALGARDCVIGLHACGELGDAMVESAASCGAAIALVGCCLQKRAALSRSPLAALAGFDAVLTPRLVLPRDVLGLSNLSARDLGVEATLAENLAARERRLALHRLLSENEPGLAHGAEIEGLNRRAAQHDLPALVARAFALRGSAMPSPARIAEAAAWAKTHHARVRRLALPRQMIARSLEVFVLLDRALHLEERGYAVMIGTLFPPEVSARNLVLLASRC